MNETLLNKTKNLYLYIQDNDSDEDCDTEYTIYRVNGDDEDGGLLCAEAYGLETNQDIIKWIIDELKWTQDEIVMLTPLDAEKLEEMIREWEDVKLKNVRKFVGFLRAQEDKWIKL